MVKVEHLDARFGSGVSAVVLKRSGHFALQAAGTFVRVDVQDFLHVCLLWCGGLVKPALMNQNAQSLLALALTNRCGLTLGLAGLP
jgi:hypothetical protein